MLKTTRTALLSPRTSTRPSTSSRASRPDAKPRTTCASTFGVGHDVGHARVPTVTELREAADNAAVESFFSLLQRNALDRRRWTTRDQLRIAIVT